MKVLLYILNLLNLITNIFAETENNQNISNIYNKNNVTLSENDQSCEAHVKEIFEILKNTTDPNRFSNLFPFFVYSSFSLNDFGDYTSCIRDEKWNYNLISYKSSIGNISIALCFYKECTADYFNTQKDPIIDLINSKYHLNITKSSIVFSNPKDNMEKLRPEFKTGLIISSMIMIIIASFSFIKLYYTLKENFKKKEISENYENFEGSVSDMDRSKGVNINFNGTSDCGSYVSSSKEIENINNIDKKRPNFFNRFLDHFDLIKHSYSIFNVLSTNITFEYMRIFDGVRCLSTAWVVWAHIFYVNSIIGVKDIYNAKKISQSFAFSFLSSGIVSVDVFFYLSGFLFYFNFAKVEGKIRNKIHFFTKSLAHRYLRLLPFYFIAIFFFTYIFPYIIEGGKSDSIHEVLTSCKTYWISNVLYLQNFWGTLNCVGHTWYLCDDMIYFIASLIIFLIFERKKIIIWTMIVLLSIFSCIWSMYVSIKYKYSLNLEKYFKIEGDFFMDFYSQPIARIVPYFMGIFYCELFLATEVYSGKNPNENILDDNLNNEQEKDKKFVKKDRYFKRLNNYLKENDSICFVIFLFSLIEINYAVFSNMITQNYDVQVFDAFLLTFNKIIFVNGLGNILHLVFLGKFQFIKSFLSMEFFSKLGKITYGIYIIHIYLIRAFFYNSNMSFRFSILEYTFYAIGLFSISAILSFIFGIFYESPMISMLKSNKSEDKDNKKNKDIKE
jgi:peptidoglycan/LPS O-acetylase OafA/YrhL